MKILFLANRVPYPPFRGDKLKIFNLAKRLCIHHELHLVTFAQNAEDWTYKSELEKYFTSVEFVHLPKWRSVLNCFLGLFDKKPFQVHYFRSGTMKIVLRKILLKEHFDIVHIQHLRMAQYLAREKTLVRILDLPDAFSLYWARKQSASHNPIRRFFEQIEQKRVYEYERILASYNLALVCSSEDKQYLEQEHHLSNISLLPNGVDTDIFYSTNHDYGHNHTLLFTGNMDYGPNVDAVCYFVADILPIVRTQYPNVQFIIAGQRPLPSVLALSNDYIKVTGFVPNLVDQYNSASIVVAPLRFGAGTQNKVLEAMAMGIPVVCSHIGFKGLGIESGDGAVMQTDKNEFAQSIIRLLSSQELRRSIGTKGIDVIRSRFGWNIIAHQLEQYFSSFR